MPALLILAPLMLAGCGPDPAEAGAGPPPVERVHAGQAWFFNATGPGQIVRQDGVEGAEVFLLDGESRQPLGHDGTFAFEGLPADRRATVGLVHPDYYPSLTASLDLSEGDVEDVTFQAVTWRIADLLGLVLGADSRDPSRCTLVATVTAMGEQQGTVFAPGEPGATVSVGPPVPEDRGPVYFDERVVPDRALTETTKDGGVILAAVEPGEYVLSAAKEGLSFDPLVMRCVGGYLTNGSPPHGLQARRP